ncbi:MAG: hypothetical protein FWB74_06600, partial [Defluviitaleaceae bacterium]|nr:hypothetical protein [Defluviitaleaceae bacterium]
MLDLLITDAHLATPLGTAAKSGDHQGAVSVTAGASIGVKDGKIAYVGLDAPAAARTLSAGG